MLGVSKNNLIELYESIIFLETVIDHFNKIFTYFYEVILLKVNFNCNQLSQITSIKESILNKKEKIKIINENSLDLINNYFKDFNKI